MTPTNREFRQRVTRLQCCIRFPIFWLAVLLWINVLSCGSTPDSIDQYTAAERPPHIDPDYGGTTIPSNIAPLNFRVDEPGSEYRIEIDSDHSDRLVVSRIDAKIQIPASSWRHLLKESRGQEIRITVYALQHDKGWVRFDDLIVGVATEEIDQYIAYRLLKPLYNKYVNMGIYERNLENFQESVVIENVGIDRVCINCHTFSENRTDNMLLHIRGKHGQRMLVYKNGKITSVDTRTAFNSAPASFTTWHPNRKLLAFTTPDASLFYHTTGETRDVFYRASDLAIYHLETNTLSTTAAISRPGYLDVFPTWSPDGRHLYFCSGPQQPIEQFAQVRCDLMRISYHAETDSWGQLETVISAEETRMSISQPRISPDGRFLVFCMFDYGVFPIFYPSSDLYMLDLHSNEFEKLPVNSNQSESWHSWSSNSRWMVFSSKRRDGLFARPHFTYVDTSGTAHKPFVLPQQDPTFYDSFTRTFNVPELIQEPIRVSTGEITSAVFNPVEAVDAHLDPSVLLKVQTETGGRSGAQNR